MCACVVNFIKNLVSNKASAMPKADKYRIAWASAITTNFGKSMTAAMSWPGVYSQECWRNSQQEKKKTWFKTFRSYFKFFLISVEFWNLRKGVCISHDRSKLFYTYSMARWGNTVLYHMTIHYLDIGHTYPVKCDSIFPVASLRSFSGSNNSVGCVCTSLV